MAFVCHVADYICQLVCHAKGLSYLHYDHCLLCCRLHMSAMLPCCEAEFIHLIFTIMTSVWPVAGYMCQQCQIPCHAERQSLMTFTVLRRVRCWMEQAGECHTMDQLHENSFVQMKGCCTGGPIALCLDPFANKEFMDLPSQYHFCSHWHLCHLHVNSMTKVVAHVA